MSDPRDDIRRGVTGDPLSVARTVAELAAAVRELGTRLGVRIASHGARHAFTGPDPVAGVWEVGDLKWVAHGETPAGWLECNGSAVNRTAFNPLFLKLGVTYGAGNGSTTFNLPDLRGRAPVGAGAGPGLTSRVRGQLVGDEAVAAHTHEVPTRFGTDSTHNHTGGAGFTAEAPTGNAGGASPLPVTSSTGSGDNMPPALVTRVLIKT